MDQGAQLGWFMEPKNRTVAIDRPGQAIEVLVNPNHVSGETILPGFVLNLERIWT